MIDRRKILLDLADQKGESLYHIATIIGVNNQTLYRYKNSESELRMSTYDSIMDYLYGLPDKREDNV